MPTRCLAGRSQEQGSGRDAFDLHFDGAGQAMLERDARVRSGVDREFDAHAAIANAVGDPNDARRERAILRPRKSLQPHDGGLAGANPPDCAGRRELGNHL